MKIEQRKWSPRIGWKTKAPQSFSRPPQVVFVFGGREAIADSSRRKDLRDMYPESRIIFCSTAGEIFDTEVSDDTLSVTAVLFEKTTLAFAATTIAKASESFAVGEALAKKLPTDGLVHTMVFSDGLLVNGTGLVQGLTHALPESVAVTGGLVGDGSRFEKTLVALDGEPASGNIVLLGFYGSALKVGYGSFGGWDPFGPARTITRSKDNILYEIDRKPALALYKEYLGEEAKGLPGSGLLFPMSVRVSDDKGEEVDVVRTLLAVDEKEQSMTFAGDMPEGAVARLMKANFERLIDGASDAAGMSVDHLGDSSPDLAILVSCIGRKLVLKDRIEEEVEAVRQRVGSQAAITGFYSYGEICPTAPTEKQCQLHNQTMTITTFRE